MVCFNNIALSECETGPRHPHLLRRLQLAARLGWHRGRKHYITKRGHGWYKPPNVETILNHTKSENLGIICLVRDPRDTMLSVYAGSKSANPSYVTQDHWYASVTAADRIFTELRDHRRKLILRYEDLVKQPLLVQSRIADTFGLRMNPRALPIDRVKDNFERLNIRFNRDELKALNGLRNMDAESVGRWRRNGPALETRDMKPHIRERFLAYCEEYHYG
jgi:hypothetical protein